MPDGSRNGGGRRGFARDDGPTARGEHGGRPDDRPVSTPLDRREFLAAAGTVVSAGVAGCQLGGDSDADARTPPTSEAVVTVMSPQRPGGVDFGPQLDPGSRHLEGFLQALVLPVRVPTGEFLPGGHTWPLDGREVSVPAAVRAVSFEGDAATARFDDRLSYWSGESLDARAFYLRERVQWLAAAGQFEEGSLGVELVDDTTLSRSDVQPNRFAGREAVHPGLPPLPPSVHEPWVDRLEGASTRATVEEGFADYYRGRVDLATFVEEGYGSGAYRVESPGDVRQEIIDLPTGAVNAPAVYATPREAYPGDVGPDRLRILTGFGAGAGGGAVGGLSMVPGGGGGGGGDPYRGANVVYSGGASFGTGVIGGSNAPLVRSNVPDRIRQRGTFPSPVSGGLGLVFNWANDHLRRLWVRRALVAAAPLDRVVANLAGPASLARTIETGLPSRVDERVFDSSFLDSLVTYPTESDTETAAEWLREAGYERPDAQWVGPDGNGLGIEVLVQGQNQVGVAGTLTGPLESFGVAVETRNVTRNAYQNLALGGDFDVAVGVVPGGWSPADVFVDRFEVVSGTVLTAPPTVAGNPLESCREEDALGAVPGTVTLPAEPGLRIEGVEYADGGATYRHEAGEDRSVCEAVRRLQADGVSEAAFREAARVCARWYNYALPTVPFLQGRIGLWADVEQLSTPSPDRDVTTVARHTPLAPLQYHLQAGTVRLADRS